jgi:heme exporter protein C
MTCVTILVSLYLIFMYAPTEATMGDVQRIFYFHFASHWVNFLAIFCVFIYSVRFLIQREKELDVKASSAAEVGLVFATIGLLTGMLWAKPVWGIWWTWDARLTSFFVLWLIYWGYLMLRRLVESPEQRARLSAVFGILGAVDVPIIYVSNRVWRTQHPQPVVAGGEGSGLDPRMAGLWLSHSWLSHFFFSIYGNCAKTWSAHRNRWSRCNARLSSRGLHELSFCFIHDHLAFAVRLPP